MQYRADLSRLLSGFVVSFHTPLLHEYHSASRAAAEFKNTVRKHSLLILSAIIEMIATAAAKASLANRVRYSHRKALTESPR